MSLISLEDAKNLNQIRLIATDMDGTLTIDEKFTPQLLKAFESLNQAGIKVLIVTGRSAGWTSGIANYLAIGGAIAENGGLFYTHNAQNLLVSISDQHRQKLSQMFQHLKAKFPQIKPSNDNPFRLTDWTFDLEDLSVEDLAQMNAMCEAQGWSFTYSTVQAHIKLSQQSKAVGLLTVLNQYFGQYRLEQVLTVGDSPNDESLFNAAIFPNSIGVANLINYRDRLAHLPAYVTRSPEGFGFCELADFLVSQT